MCTKNYKVKCVEYKTSERYFTIGKVYDVVDNKITSDKGFTYKNHKNVIDWLSPWYEFEIVNKSDCNIEKVIFNDPATIVIWDDGTKTVVKCQEGDEYNAELGLAMCISKKYFGNKGNFNEVFKKWIPEEISLPLGFKYEEDPQDLEPIKVGTRIKIINGGRGAYGANGKTGVVMRPNTYVHDWRGLCEEDLGYYVKTENNKIWKIAFNAKIEILEEG